MSRPPSKKYALGRISFLRVFLSSVNKQIGVKPIKIRRSRHPFVADGNGLFLGRNGKNEFENGRFGVFHRTHHLESPVLVLSVIAGEFLHLAVLQFIRPDIFGYVVPVGFVYILKEVTQTYLSVLVKADDVLFVGIFVEMTVDKVCGSEFVYERGKIKIRYPVVIQTAHLYQNALVNRHFQFFEYEQY